MIRSILCFFGRHSPHRYANARSKVVVMVSNICRHCGEFCS